MNSKYKAGDRVIIRDDLKAGKSYGTNNVTSGMLAHSGYTAMVNQVSESEYKLDTDCGSYWWTDEMLVDLSTQMHYEVGDEVTIRDDLTPCGHHGGVYVNEKMTKYFGRTYRVIEDNYMPEDFPRKYRLEGCETWAWTAEMFVPPAPLSPSEVYSSFLEV